MIMNKHNELSSFKLMPVKTAPFFAVGILLCSQDTLFAAIMLAVSAVLIAIVGAFAKKLFPSALALFLGMACMTAYGVFVCEPVISSHGTTQTLVCTVNEIQDFSGYSLYKCSTHISSIGTKLTFYDSGEHNIGDIITADIMLSKGSGDLPAERMKMHGTLKNIRSTVRPDFSLARTLNDWRKTLEIKISKGIGGNGGILSEGMLFGDTSHFSSELRRSAKISGVMHFTAVSGMHFVIIMSVLLELLGAKHAWLRAGAAAACIPLAVMFFGCDASVLRAGIMMLLCSIGPLFCRKADSLNSLCMAVLLMTAFSPQVMLDIGFQMSVMGVFGVSVVGNRCVRLLNSALRKLPAVIKSFIGAIASSACAVICIAPISISAFGGISLLGALSTVVLSPVFAAALTVAVCFAVTGLGILIAPLGVLMNVAYYIIAFLGQFTGAWLSMDFNYAPVIAWLCATALTAALLIPRKLLSVGTFTAAAAAILNLTLCFFTANDRKMIDFISDGSSGAAVICNRSEATILICGDGARLGNKLSDCLLSHGIQSIELIAAYDLSAASCESLAEICALYPTDTISVSKPAATVLSAALHDTEITTEKIAHINANGVTIACAKTNDTECTADIVLYSGYKQTVPKHGGILPLYISSRQELLPRGGVNIYDTDFEIDLENYYG
ncbi:MAG: ComEC/Rec2 family competence protein [Ruminococcaceae bacterium]|nr:ComEC/Rec2 family competence protein [Oscillospiraceae bacterium]